MFLLKEALLGSQQLQDKLNGEFDTRLKQLERKSTKKQAERKNTVDKFIDLAEIREEWWKAFDRA